ncbi:MAG: sigma-54-dependent transcriptional regulator [Gammaproteobacteria bacterium]
MSKAHILVVDDEPEIRTAVGEILGDEGYEVVLAADAQAARREMSTLRPDLVLLDVWMEGEDGISLLRDWSSQPGGVPPVVMISGHGTVDTAIEATRLGALDFIEKPVSLAKLLYMVERALKSAPRRREPLGAAPLLDVIDAHPAIAALKRALEVASGHPEPALIVGESGTGRETLARRLARLDQRSFVALMLADTDAAKLRAATATAERMRGPVFLFLNELTDAPASMQELLAALIADSSGALRFAASAGPEVSSRLAAGQLRRALYDQLAVFVIEVPPLRAYQDFLPEIIRYYVDDLAGREGYVFRRFDVAALNRLRRHDWPGNLQELGNLVKRVLVNGSHGSVGIEEVDAALAAAAPTVPRLGEDLLWLPYREARERFERAYLQAQLELADGKVAQLAERVGLERTHLYRKLKALGIELPGDEKVPD